MDPGDSSRDDEAARIATAVAAISVAVASGPCRRSGDPWAGRLRLPPSRLPSDSISKRSAPAVGMASTSLTRTLSPSR